MSLAIFPDPTPYVRCPFGHEWPAAWGQDDCRRCGALERIAELEHAWESTTDDTDPAVVREALAAFAQALEGFVTGPLADASTRANEAPRISRLREELARLTREAQS